MKELGAHLKKFAFKEIFYYKFQSPHHSQGGSGPVQTFSMCGNLNHPPPPGLDFQMFKFNIKVVFVHIQGRKMIVDT